MTTKQTLHIIRTLVNAAIVEDETYRLLQEQEDGEELALQDCLGELEAVLETYRIDGLGR